MARRTCHTLLSRAAAVVTVVMAAASAATLAAGAPHYVVLLVVAATGAAVLAAAKMWRDNCFESRLVTVVVAAGTLGWQALLGTVGGPVTGRVQWNGLHTAVLVSAACVLACVATDAVRRRLRSPGERLPYAL